MGCGQSSTKQVLRREAFTIPNGEPQQNSIVTLPNIQLVLKKSGCLEHSLESLPVTQAGTPEDEILKAVYLVKSGDIQYRVPRLLPPEAASTIARRRRCRQFEIFCLPGPDGL